MPTSNEWKTEIFKYHVLASRIPFDQAVDNAIDYLDDIYTLSSFEMLLEVINRNVATAAGSFVAIAAPKVKSLRALVEIFRNRSYNISHFLTDLTNLLALVSVDYARIRRENSKLSLQSDMDFWLKSYATNPVQSEISAVDFRLAVVLCEAFIEIGVNEYPPGFSKENFSNLFNQSYDYKTVSAPRLDMFEKESTQLLKHFMVGLCLGNTKLAAKLVSAITQLANAALDLDTDNIESALKQLYTVIKDDIGIQTVNNVLDLLEQLIRTVRGWVKAYDNNYYVKMAVLTETSSVRCQTALLEVYSDVMNSMAQSSIAGRLLDSNDYAEAILQASAVQAKNDMGETAYDKAISFLVNSNHSDDSSLYDVITQATKEVANG